ncbi:MAG: outer membrane beta-barrel protein, partial [Bacteroidota bacterium]
SARGNLQRKSGWVFSTELSYTGFSGLDAGFRQNFLLWNAGIGYKFLKDQKGEFRLTAFDLLGQNNSLNRSVTETYVEDVQTRVLQRYIMLNFTYNIRKFKRPAGLPGGGMNPMMMPR